MAASIQKWQCQACGALLESPENHVCPGKWHELPRTAAEAIARLARMRREGPPADGIHIARSGALTSSWCDRPLHPYTWVLLEETLANARPGSACVICLERLNAIRPRRN